jgi:hypothetical protein
MLHLKLDWSEDSARLYLQLGQREPNYRWRFQADGVMRFVKRIKITMSYKSKK